MGAVTNQLPDLAVDAACEVGLSRPAWPTTSVRWLPRGEREAGLAGDWIRAHAPAVDAVLCSTATRTRETLERTRIDAPVHYVDRLYDATPGTVIDEINGVDPFDEWRRCW